MLRNYTIAFTIFFMLLSCIAAFTQPTYCTIAGPSSTADSDLDLFSFVHDNGTFDFQNDCAQPVTSVETITDTSATFSCGTSYSGSFTTGTCGGNFTNVLEVWIDFDQSGTFDPNESILFDGPSPVFTTDSFTFVVPQTAFLGLTGMRIVQQETGLGSSLDPCASFAWGSVLDLTVDVTCANLITGCTDPCDANFDPMANISDPSFCSGMNLCGCTNPSALNYDPTASVDDGTCLNRVGDNCSIPDTNLFINPLGTPDSLCVNDTVFVSLGGYDLTNSGIIGTCNSFAGPTTVDYWYSWVATSLRLQFTSVSPIANLGNPSITIYKNDNCPAPSEIICASSFSDNVLLEGWNIGDTLFLQIQDGTMNVFVDQAFCLKEVISGCTNPIANNYNPNATFENGSCEIDGSNCATANLLNGCSGAFVQDTIYSSTIGAVVTGKFGSTSGSRWYIFEALSSGMLELNFTTPILNTEVSNPESYIHDLGPGIWTGTAADSTLCSNVNFPAVDVDAFGGQYSNSQIVIGGNVYAIEIGNNWTNFKFDWDWLFGCEALTGLNAITTATTAEISFNDVLSDSTQVTADITYSIQGATPGTTTTLTGISNPMLLSGLNSGIIYDYCLSYPCSGSSGCSSLQSCSTFATDPSCTVPIIQISAACIANGFFGIDVQVNNAAAFASTLSAPGNPNGFDVYLNTGAGYVDSGVDVTSAGTNFIIPGSFASGSPVLIQLIGKDASGCPSAISSLDVDCSCFGLSPTNDVCANATNLIVGNASTCDQGNTQYTLACSGVDALDPFGTCFNAGLNANVWFSFVAPAGGAVRISTDYIGGTLVDTEIALYSGTCGNLAEINCDQDGGNIVIFNSIITESNLIPGDTYYILVDRWGTSPNGTFCIDVVDTNPSGCTDLFACNYDPFSIFDDGSCNYTVTFNVDMACPDFLTNDNFAFGSVGVSSPLFGWCAGCVPLTDSDGDGVWSVDTCLPPGAFEYKYEVDGFSDQENLIDDVQNGDGACAAITDGASFANRLITVPSSNGLVVDDFFGYCTAPIVGCTVLGDPNYNPQATCDDGSCKYLVNFNCQSNIEYTSDVDGGYTSISQVSTTITNSASVGNTAGDVELKSEGHILLEDGFLSPEASSYVILSGDICSGLVGCINPAACNYNAQAIYDDGTCNVPQAAINFGCLNPCTAVLGCTDPAADNYAANATCNNGLCTYTISACTDPTACNFNPLATADNGSCLFIGNSCDDLDSATINDVINSNCICKGQN